MHAGVRRRGRWAGRVDLGGCGNGGGGSRDSSRSRSTLVSILGRAVDTATVGDELTNVWARIVFGDLWEEGSCSDQIGSGGTKMRRRQ